MINFFKPGWRTIKTAVSVFLCIICYHFVQSTPAIACLSTVFALRESPSKTLSFGKSRLISNAFGGLLALCLFQIKLWSHSPLLMTFLVPLGVIIFIQTMNLWKNQAGIISGLAALFMIYFTIPLQNSVHYAIFRVLDTFVGVIIAIIVNYFIHPYQEPSMDEKIQQLNIQIDNLQKQKQKLLEQKETSSK